MGISIKQLEEEKAALQFTFDQLNVKIKTVEAETQKMRNNLNAVHGALQQMDKLIRKDMIHGDGKGREVENEEGIEPSAASLEIKEKEQVRLLKEEQAAKEGDK
jgi:hypothetical protein|tara:strand:+ start:478 stop:789 length:312 start_codon:yes stop_codon:yes gene_type:complete